MNFEQPKTEKLIIPKKIYGTNFKEGGEASSQFQQFIIVKIKI